MDKNRFYRRIPGMNILLGDEELHGLIVKYGRDYVRDIIRAELDALREVADGEISEQELDEQIGLLPERVIRRTKEEHTLKFRRVINGTGVILHTNLGRAPVGALHIEKILEAAKGYSNLEYDLETGNRGERYSHFEGLLCRLTGAEAAMAVNNNAAAVLLILSALAQGGEAIVSRGELVEIGGKFRIPDVMEQSGTILREVGCTNRTRIDDYENAVNENTRTILKVHTSNYRIVGFAESVSLEELASLGAKYGIPVVEDLGSGTLLDLKKYGLPHCPYVADSIAKGADIVCFSGDKLLGGVQAGIIVGKKVYIDRLKKHPLTRAVRIDKFTAAACEVILIDYLSEETAVKNIPVLKMLTRPMEEITWDADSLCRMIRRRRFPGSVSVIPCDSQAGGGSLPTERLPSMAVAVRPEKISAVQLEKRLRSLAVPILARVMDDSVCLDVRTIDRTEFKLIADQIVSAADN